MKKIVFVFLMVIVFGGLKASAQEKYLTIKGDETKILVPYKFNEFKEVGKKNRKHFEVSLEDDIKMEYLYFDTNTNVNLINKEYFITKLDKFILIQSLHNNKSTTFFTYNELKNHNDIYDTTIIYFVKKNDLSNDYYINYNTLNDSIKSNQTKTITKIHVLVDYYFLLNQNIKSTKNIIQKWLVTYKDIKIKDEFISVQFACIYNGVESIKWIGETSENWCRYISDLNYKLNNKNNVLQVKINGSKIKIPNLKDDFVMVNKHIHKHRIDAGDFTYFSCHFIDNSNYYLIHESDTNYNIKLRYLDIDDMSENQDDDEIKNIYKIFPFDTTKLKIIESSKSKDAIENLINYFADTNGYTGNKILQKNCIIHISNDAIAYINVKKDTYFRKKHNSVEICYYIIIKNRYLEARFVSEDYTIEDIIWAKDISEKWVQVILEANK